MLVIVSRHLAGEHVDFELCCHVICIVSRSVFLSEHIAGCRSAVRVTTRVTLEVVILVPWVDADCVLFKYLVEPFDQGSLLAILDLTNSEAC